MLKNNGFYMFEEFYTYCSDNQIKPYENNALNNYLDYCKKNLERNFEKTNLHYGLRTEKMFESLANTMGRVEYIEKITPAHNKTNFSAPDYKVILKDENPIKGNIHYQKKFFVEVKNSHIDIKKQKFSFRKKYFQELKRYADLMEAPVKIAVYYSQVNIWVLLSMEAFTETKKKFEIDFLDALKKNEMGYIGDTRVYCKNDVSIIMGCKIEKETDTELLCSPLNADLYYCNSLVTNNKIKNFLFMGLLQGITTGNWTNTLNVKERKKDFCTIEYQFQPFSINDSWCYLSVVSSLLSTYYKNYTQEGDKITSLETLTDIPFLPTTTQSIFQDSSIPLLGLCPIPNYQESLETIEPIK